MYIKFKKNMSSVLNKDNFKQKELKYFLAQVKFRPKFNTSNLLSIKKLSHFLYTC